MLGTEIEIRTELTKLQRTATNMRVERFTRDEQGRLGRRRPISRARRTTAALRALEELTVGIDVHYAIRGLAVSELLWLAREVQPIRRSNVLDVIASRCLEMERSTSTLNLRGSSFRALHMLARSREAYEASLDLVASGHHNPYGHIGLAATLRRLGELDDAYDHVKKALKYYPEDEYGLRTKAAILRQMTDFKVLSPDLVR